MRTLKAVFLFMLCVSISGCQQNLIDELENENSEQEQEIVELTDKVAELNTLVKNLEVENEKQKNIIADYEQSKHPIEVEFENEMMSWSGNTGEGVRIIVGYGDQWKEEMGKYYDLLYDELDEDKRKWLTSSQAQWEVFTKENEELAWQVNDQMHHGGSIMHILNADIYYHRFRERALFLKEQYEIISYDY